MNAAAWQALDQAQRCAHVNKLHSEFKIEDECACSHQTQEHYAHDQMPCAVRDCDCDGLRKPRQ